MNNKAQDTKRLKSLLYLVLVRGIRIGLMMADTRTKFDLKFIHDPSWKAMRDVEIAEAFRKITKMFS